LSLSPRRRRLLAILALALLGLGLLGGGLVRSSQMRHAAAKSLRTALGPPEPPPMLLESPPSIPIMPMASDMEAPALEPVTPPQRPPELAGVSFVLLLGADNRSDKVVGRTDTMMIAAFRHRDGKVGLFSVPRDLWVPLPDVGELHEQGHTHARISSVLRVGEVRLGRGQGLPLLRQTLREQLGVRVDRYASIDFAGFVGLIDELGGIDVEVECPLVDCFWLAGPSQPCERVSIPAGRVHMDGATALAFVRSRHGRGDHDRTRRQQAVILAFAREVRARGLRGLAPLWRRAEPFVRTDLAAEDAAYYASFALENQLDDLAGFAIRHPMTRRHVTEDGKHVLLLDRAAFDRALGELFEQNQRGPRLPSRRDREQCPAADVALTYRDG
jgi:LCP family protein required for cell wall assembly